jgi:hypothetical protein
LNDAWSVNGDISGGLGAVGLVAGLAGVGTGIGVLDRVNGQSITRLDHFAVLQPGVLWCGVTLGGALHGDGAAVFVFGVNSGGGFVEVVNAQLLLGGDVIAHVVFVVIVVGSAGNVLKGFGAAGNGLGAGRDWKAIWAIDINFGLGVAIGAAVDSVGFVFNDEVVALGVLAGARDFKVDLVGVI